MNPPSNSPPKIVVLDGYTTNPGDLDWQPLQRLSGDCAVHDRTLPGEILSRAQNAAVLLTNKTPLTAETLAALPDLRFIGVLATGYNVVDMDAARKRNIVVCNVPAYGTASVAQATFALLLHLTHRTAHHADLVRNGQWAACPDFSFWDGQLTELAGQTMGIVGYGEIGQAVSRIARAFGMDVIVHTRTPKPSDEGDGVRFVSLGDLFSQSDVVSLHCPLTAQTEKLVNADRLARMKPTAFLLNTARGPLVDEAALADALSAGRLAGAGLDVLTAEPPKKGNVLIGAKNCVVTPHFAWATRAARTRLLHAAAQNVQAFLEGRAQNVVS